VRATIAEFERSMQKVETRAGKVLAERVKEAAHDFTVQLQQRLDQPRPRGNANATPAQQSTRKPAALRFVMIVAAVAIAVFTVGVWIGIQWNN